MTTELFWYYNDTYPVYRFLITRKVVTELTFVLESHCLDINCKSLVR